MAKGRRNRRPKKVAVECSNCGYRWYPNPRMWRNKLNPRNEKVLRCLSCGMPNHIDKQTVKRIVQNN